MNQPISGEFCDQSETRFLNGFRGIAALIVMMEHYMYAFYPMVMNDHLNMVDGLPMASLAAYTPANILFNGNAAVALFFVLSGFVLSLGFFQERQGYDLVGVLLRTVRRYFRLALPVFGAFVLIYLIFLVGGFYQGELTKSSVAVNPNYYEVTPSFWQVVKLAFSDVMLKGSYAYNPAFWTMKYELFGSFIVFALIAAYGTMKFLGGYQRAFIYLSLIFFLYDGFYWSFVAGMLLADLYVNRNTFFELIGQKPLYSIIMTIFTVILLGFTKKGGDTGWYSFLLNQGVTEFQGHTLGALILMLLALSSNRFQKYLNSRVLMYLGSISFSIYLLHYLVMSSIVVYVYLIMVDLASNNIRFLITFTFVGLPTTILMSHYFDKYINKLAIRLPKKLARKLDINERDVTTQSNRKTAGATNAK